MSARIASEQQVPRGPGHTRRSPRGHRLQRQSVALACQRRDAASWSGSQMNINFHDRYNHRVTSAGSRLLPSPFIVQSVGPSEGGRVLNHTAYTLSSNTSHLCQSCLPDNDRKALLVEVNKQPRCPDDPEWGRT